jgi:uncharacterized membrane protein
MVQGQPARVEAPAWTGAGLLFLGVWLIASPPTLGYAGAMLWSDLASGALIAVFAAVALLRRSVWPLWACCFTAIWLLFAPLVFWTKSPAAYANSSLVGVLVLLFAVLIPYGSARPGPDVPAGWSYNPSAWPQRIPIIAIGLGTFFIARYMSSFQLGHIDSVWDPFFGDGTRNILHSDVSRAFPIPDAGLGAVAYLLEALSGCIGDTRRWRTMPWMVLLFWVLVVPPGVTSVVLVILQPLAVGDWCTLCLITALATLITVPPALDEVIAMFYYLKRARKAGRPFWRTFWLGGEEVGEAAPAPAASGGSWILIPPYLLAAGLLGVWLIAAPPVIGFGGGLSDSGRLVGALVTTFAVVAMAEVGRPLRFVNVLFGAWVALSPFLLGGPPARLVAYHHIATGLLIIAVSFPRGRVEDKHGEWDRYIR